MNLTVISGGLGHPSSTRLLADRLADATVRGLAARSGGPGEAPRISVVELRELAVPVAQALTSNHRAPVLADALESIRTADAVILATPVFNAAVAGPTLSLLDLLTPDDLAGVPVLLGATGGTIRHSQAVDGLRPVLAYLGALVAPTTVFVATEEWGQGEPGRGSGPQTRIDRAGAELARLLDGAGRQPVADPYDSVVPFDQQLARVAAG